MTDTAIESQRDKPRKPSRSARHAATRLAAAQLVYEHFLTKVSIKKILQDFQLNRRNAPIDEREEGEERLIDPEINMLSDIFKVLDEERDGIEAMLNAFTAQKEKAPELLLKAIFFCGSAELYSAEARSIDTPIIINDYLNVTRAFFNEGEVKFMNGLLNHAKESVTL